MANELITPQELATWTRNDVAEVSVDPLAIEIMEKVSSMAKFFGGRDGNTLDADGAVVPEWTYESAPFDVKMVVLQVAKRCYENPGQVVQEGSVGPIGGDRFLDVAALLLNLTDSERATLTKYNLNGDPDADKSGGLWVLSTTKGEDAILDAIYFVPDDQQINIETTNAFPSWDVPMFSPGDPGDPNLYIEP